MASTNIEKSSLGTRLATLIATGFGSGLAPIASGTFGSAAAIILWWIMCFLLENTVSLSENGIFVAKGGLLILTFIVSIPCVNVLIEDKANLDPKEVVIDEFLGMWISAFLLNTHSSLWMWIASFFLFRFFDVLKPPPASNAENLPGAYGVITDDLIAGVMALASLYVLALIV